MKKKHLCEILEKKELVPGAFDITVGFHEKCFPGQFIHIGCGDGVFLRRPISICDFDGERLRFCFAIRGEGTKRLAAFEKGDPLDILGPLGNPFKPEKKGAGVPLVIGGGIGIYPLLFLAKRLGEKTEAILGFRTQELISMKDDFEAVCARTHIATDDGTFGVHGVVTDILSERVKAGDISAIYACGPSPMMKTVKEIAAENKIACELSMEQRMGCGIGVCAVCVCKSKGEYVKVCQRGPVFDAGEVDFDD